MAKREKAKDSISPLLTLPSRSASEVFGLPELFEMILIESSMKDVLLWQRVDKTFNRVIAHSKTLQQRLFFRPMDADERKPVLNRLVRNHFVRILHFETTNQFIMHISPD
ncbi:hypothetical protein LTR95_012531 [Oleoguttula sp. CCFEE 5521]